MCVSACVCGEGGEKNQIIRKENALMYNRYVHADSFMYVCMRVCVCMRVYIYIYIYIGVVTPNQP